MISHRYWDIIITWMHFLQGKQRGPWSKRFFWLPETFLQLQVFLWMPEWAVLLRASGQVALFQHSQDPLGFLGHFQVAFPIFSTRSSFKDLRLAVSVFVEFTPRFVWWHAVVISKDPRRTFQGSSGVSGIIAASGLFTPFGELVPAQETLSRGKWWIGPERHPKMCRNEIKAVMQSAAPSIQLESFTLDCNGAERIRRTEFKTVYLLIHRLILKQQSVWWLHDSRLSQTEIVLTLDPNSWPSIIRRWEDSDTAVPILWVTGFITRANLVTDKSW